MHLPRAGVATPSRPFQPHRWLANAHLQTLVGSVARPNPKLELQVHELPSAHGDTLRAESLPLARARARVLILHGLTGCSRAAGIRYLMKLLADHEFEPWALNFRGADGRVPEVPRLYHAGSSDDLEAAMRALPDELPLHVVGFSLGANIMLKWFGEQGARARAQSGMAVCSPLDLGRCAQRLEESFMSRGYRRYLVTRLKKTAARFAARFPEVLDGRILKRLVTFRDFDHEVAAPIHGFDGADHYWDSCSSIYFLEHIRRPVLLLNSRDDPFLDLEVLPLAHRYLITEYPRHGGHLGFIGPGGHCWMEQRLLVHLEAQCGQNR